MRASATIACRALVMLGCLVVIPLAAVSGSSLTTWVDTALEGKWPWADQSAPGANQTDPQFELMSPDEAVWPSNLRPPAQVVRPAQARPAGAARSHQSVRPGNTAHVQALGLGQRRMEAGEAAQAASASTSRVDPAVVSAGWDAPMICRDGVCRLVGTTAAPPPAQDASQGVSPGAPRTSHGPAQTASPYHVPPGSQRTHPSQSSVADDRSAQAWPLGGLSAVRLSGAAPAPADHRGVAQTPALKEAGEDRFTRLGSRLQQLGATYYLLEHWGNGQYRFYCRMAIAGNPRLTQNFEQIDADPLKAMARVVEQVEAWRTTVP